MEKTKEGKKRLIGEVAEIVEGVQSQIGKVMAVAEVSKTRLKVIGRRAVRTGAFPPSRPPGGSRRSTNRNRRPIEPRALSVRSGD